MNQARCRSRKQDGTRCEAQALPGKASCVFHDPSSAESRADGRRRGGKTRSRPAAVLPASTPDAPLGTEADVVTLLGATINQVRRGELDTKVGNCLALLCGQLIRAMQGSDLAARVEMLEAVLKLRNVKRVKK